MAATKPRITEVRMIETETRDQTEVFEDRPSAKLIQKSKMIPARIKNTLRGVHFILKAILMTKGWSMLISRQVN